MQLGDPLSSYQVLGDDQVGYWTDNGRIDRTVEAPRKPSRRPAQCHLLFINCTPVYLSALTIRKSLEICHIGLLQLPAATGYSAARSHGVSLTTTYI